MTVTAVRAAHVVGRPQRRRRCPTATASWPWQVCVVPWISPSANSSLVRSSKRRISSIRSQPRDRR